MSEGKNLPFGGAAIVQNVDLCLNVRHRAAGCTRCVTTCPVDALALVGGEPVLDADKCVQCGLCLHGCPTEVFSQPHAAEVQLVRTVEQLPAQPIILVCTLHPTAQQTAAPVTTIVQHRRCLAALSVEQLLALSHDGERTLWLDDSPCTACPLGKAQANLQQSVTTANALLQAFDHSATIFLQSAHVDQLRNKATRHPFIDSATPPVSRRGLFAALGRAVSAKTKPTAPPLSPSISQQPQPVSARLPQRVPTGRTALQERMTRWTHTGTADVNLTVLPFADVQIDAALCSACSLCARFCPTGALRFTAEETHFSLNFQPARCIDCPICTVACPEQAIRMGGTLPSAALVTDEWLPLLEGELTQCQQCEMPTADQPDAQGVTHCYACRHGAGMVQPLRDGAGLMADLLQRLPTAKKEPSVLAQ